MAEFADKDKFDKRLTERTCKKLVLLNMKVLKRSIKWVLLFILIIFSEIVSAQHQHFIYLQHEQSVSFYVKYQGQIYRSSPQGYLIISKISKGRITLYLGLEKSDRSELSFSFESIDSDKGFLIKNFGDKSWGLYDLQQATLLYADLQEQKDPVSASKIYSDTAMNDAFGNMLAEVTKDTTVKYVAIKKNSIIADSSVEKYINSSSVYLVGKVEKASSDLFTFHVDGRSGRDTVGVEIEKAIRLSVQDSSLISENKDTLIRRIDKKPDLSKGNLSRSDSVVNKKIFVDEILISDLSSERTIGGGKDTLIQVSDSVKSVVQEIVVPLAADSVLVVKDSAALTSALTIVVKADCRRLADEDIFIRVRKKMAGKRTEDQMIEEALKGYKQACFTTQQIAQLSGMFMSDEMRYRFFDASFKYVSDPGLYSSLGKFIQDPYYKKRFEALLPNPQ